MCDEERRSEGVNGDKERFQEGFGLADNEIDIELKRQEILDTVIPLLKSASAFALVVEHETKEGTPEFRQSVFRVGPRLAIFNRLMADDTMVKALRFGIDK